MDTWQEIKDLNNKARKPNKHTVQDLEAGDRIRLLCWGERLEAIIRDISDVPTSGYEYLADKDMYSFVSYEIIGEYEYMANKGIYSFIPYKDIGVIDDTFDSDCWIKTHRINDPDSYVFYLGTA